ncbi:MAG: TIGR03915 family putative DNA repair protein [Akkermansiaceae bacterium]|nr:TIGR03915 family putative DNA repair protein [Akkermansiaceae bacterium]
MRTVSIPPRFEDWRDTARELLAAQVPPEELLWSDGGEHSDLFGELELPPPTARPPKVSKAFLDLARSAACHRDERRWALLYRLLWRMTHGGEPHLLSLATDLELRQVQRWTKAVGRDIHKLHAFVRFRKVDEDPETGREGFVAWYEPDHLTLRLGAPFFRKRFSNMNWSILTPDECAHWDGKALRFTDGVNRDAAPEGDDLDELWRTYYRSIFNPARLKVKMMQSQMPRKFWKNLPEAEIIEELIKGSSGQVQQMLDTEERPAKPAPNNAYLKSLHEMNRKQAEEKRS